jgi:hypothetical protein
MRGTANACIIEGELRGGGILYRDRIIRMDCFVFGYNGKRIVTGSIMKYYSPRSLHYELKKKHSCNEKLVLSKNERCSKV